MTDAQLNEILEGGGNASLHYLIKISGVSINTILLCNNNEDITFLNEKYSASSFEYTPPKADGSGARLSISSLPNNNTVYEELENAGYNEIISLRVYEVLVSGSDIKRTNFFYSLRGNFSMNYKGELEYNPEADDRDSMTFPPYTFDTDNNRGNA